MQFPTVGNYNISNCMFYIMSSHSMEFEYLNDVPVMTLDVNEDFKGDKIKCANMIEKVGTVSACVKIRNHQLMLSLLFIYCISMYVFARFNKSLHLPHFPSKMEISNEWLNRFEQHCVKTQCCKKMFQIYSLAVIKEDSLGKMLHETEFLVIQGSVKSKVMICAFVGLDFNANLTPFLFLFFAFL